MDFHVIIPARYTSSRLPGKALLDIGGKPMIQWVYECAEKSGAGRATVATDDERIREAVVGFGGDVCMTAVEHRSGTDRVAEAARLRGLEADTVVVNVQGDEPGMPPALIRQVAQTLVDTPSAAMATACHALSDPASLRDPNVVKVVRDSGCFALYFSRAPIPWPGDDKDGAYSRGQKAFRHIGLYAYRAGFVAQFAAWPPCELEQIESLEQLRALWYGKRIVVCDAVEDPGPGVDTPENLERVRRRFAGS